MIFEVCAIVTIIILGVVGLELTLWLRSVRKLVDETNQTVRTLNAHLPAVADDVQAMSTLLRKTTEQVGGTVNAAAAGLGGFWKNPMGVVAKILMTAQQLTDLWYEIRHRDITDPDPDEETDR